jgi:TonB family protein
MEAGDKLSFGGAQGQEIGSYEKVPFAYSAVKIESVHKSSTAIEIKGQRVAQVFQTPSLPLSTKDLGFIPLKEPVRITIAVNASDLQASELALNQVFAATAADALRGETSEEQQLELNTIGSITPVDGDLPKNLVKSSEIIELIKSQNGAKITKPTQLGPNGGVAQFGPQATADDQTSVPILTCSVDPKFTDEAREMHTSGLCFLNMVVDTSGYPTHIRVAKSVDPGLDMQAVIAASQYRFKPARFKGQVVPMQVNVAVNFRIP